MASSEADADADADAADAAAADAGAADADAATLRDLGDVLTRLAAADATGAAEVQALREGLDRIVDILVARGALNEGHRRLIARAAAKARAAVEKPRVHLKLHEPDKRTIGGGDIDCASLIDLCKARCCSFRFVLSLQDVEEGIVKFTLDDPYKIRQERDGYCTHIDRAAGGGCTIYPDRPVPCRTYDCREDARVWIDFAKRIPAPMPDGVTAVR